MKSELEIADGGMKRILFLLSPNLILLDLAGPWDVFEAANFIASQRGDKPLYKLESVSITSEKEIRVQGGLTLRAERSCAEFVGAVDTFIVCGAQGMRDLAPGQTRTPEVLRLFKKARRVASICVGAFFLASAGMLDGRRATTHWRGCELLGKSYPRVAVELDSIFVQDGAFYTSGGVTAGIDLALALVEEDMGRDMALAVARRLVVSPRRGGGQAQYGASTPSLPVATESLNALMDWARANPTADLSVEALAQRSGMSERNFSRVFKREASQTPAEFIERLRVDEARKLLEESDSNLDEVAVACGLGSADSMRRVFLRVIKVTPGGYRSRFRS